MVIVLPKKYVSSDEAVSVASRYSIILRKEKIFKACTYKTKQECKEVSEHSLLQLRRETPRGGTLPIP